MSAFPATRIRCELTHTTVPLIKQREIVKLFRLSKSLRFSHGRFKSGPWQYGLNRGNHITTAGARFDKSLADTRVEPYFLVDRFAAGVKLFSVRTLGFLEHLTDLLLRKPSAAARPVCFVRHRRELQASDRVIGADRRSIHLRAAAIIAAALGLEPTHLTVQWQIVVDTRCGARAVPQAQ
jgi:hypothetical protein